MAFEAVFDANVIEVFERASLEICGVTTGGSVVVTTGGSVVVTTGGPVVVSRRGDSIRDPVAGSKVTFQRPIWAGEPIPKRAL